MFNFFKKKQTVDMWDMFSGKKNTPEVLGSKAELLSVLLIDWSIDNTTRMLEAVKKEDNELNVEKIQNIIRFEVLFFWIHYVDRMAYSILKSEQRDFFMKSLLGSLTNILSKSQSNENAKIAVASLLTDSYNERQTEYAIYKIAANKDEGMAGTLFWEVGKKIAAIFGSKNDIIDVMKVQIFIVNSLKHMQIDLLLQERK